MRESLEAMQQRLPSFDCGVPKCKGKATHRPIIHIPKLEGVDKTPPRAEIDFLLCDNHAGSIDPIMFLSLPVRLHLENALVKFAERPLLKPVDWNEAKVEFEKLPEIVIEEG